MTQLQADDRSTQGAETGSGPSTDLPHYLVGGDDLEYGASFGNAHCWLTTRGDGSIQEMFSSDLGEPVAGALTIRYGDTGHGLLAASIHGSPGDGSSDVQLRPVAPGTIELHPAYQRRRIPLPDGLEARETVFVGLVSGDDPAVAYYQVEMTNRGPAARAVRVYAFGRLCGALGQHIVARYDGDLGALIGVPRDQPQAVRVFGCTSPVAAYETSHDFGRVYDVLHMQGLDNETSAEGDRVAALQVEISLAPGQSRDMTFVLAFAPTGEADATATYRQARDSSAVLAETIAYVGRITAVSQVLTPDREINAGTLWSKVNMLRVMANYPHGPSFTNEPGVSSAVVARDAAWFVYGNDHFLPAFSRAQLDAFATRRYPDGGLPLPPRATIQS